MNLVVDVLLEYTICSRIGIYYKVYDDSWIQINHDSMAFIYFVSESNVPFLIPIPSIYIN